MAEQILKLGILGSETTLSAESRTFQSSGNTESSVSGRSADGTLHVDYVARKKQFTINYTTLTEALKDTITAIYDLQISTPAFLNFIYTNQAETEIATVVKMEAPNFGATTPKNVFYYGGTTISLEEV